MQTRPTNWAAVFAAPHITEYKFVINGVTYLASDVQGTPSMEKPLMQEPCIGRCCTGSLNLTIRKHAGESIIPKAASVIAYCRLKARVGGTTTAWVEKGHYWISRRSATGDLVTLTCRDSMLLAGQTYLDKTQFNQWPVPMTSVFNEIVSLMGVSVDSRTIIKTDTMYRVDYPNDDVLMSEILSHIAAAHGGNFIMSDEGKIRLVTYPDTLSPVQAIGSSYARYKPLSTGRRNVSRVTLTDSANNQFTCGDDTGIELTGECEYATQAMVDAMSNGYALDGGSLLVTEGTLANGVLTVSDNSFSQDGLITFSSASSLIGRGCIPYELTGAYIDPLVELGDTVSIVRKGETVNLVIGTMIIRCNPSFVCDFRNGVEDDDEDEVPYVSMADIRAKRYISTTKSYYGNRINRTEGFVSEFMKNDVPVARMVANADRFSMQRLTDSGEWEDCLYFDPIKRTYKFKGEVEISTLTDVSAASLTATSLVFAADASGNTLARTCVSKVFAYTGSEKVQPVVTEVIGVVDGMTVSIGDAVDKQIPITISVPTGVNLGSTDSTGGMLYVRVTSPVQADLEISWSKINTGAAGADGAPGQNGAPGAPGQNGQDGVTYYTWIKYADTPTSGMSDTPDGKKYIGIAYNKATPEPSTSYSDYGWSLIKGADGTNGYNSTVIQLYQRVSSDLSTPAGDTTFTFSNNTLTGNLGMWSRWIPEGKAACYTTMAAVSSTNDVVTIPASVWSEPILLVENGTDGAPGQDGTNGEDGYNTAFIYLYKRAESSPATPTVSTLFTFATSSLTGTLDGWTQNIPSTNGNPCWVTSANVAAKTATVPVPASAWNTPAKLVEDGESGSITYCQPTAPANGVEGDLWIDSDDNYKLYRHDGTQWVSVQDANIPDIIEQLVAAQTSLEVLNKSIEATVTATYVTNQIDSLVETFNSALKLQADELTASFEGTAQNAAGEVNQKFSTLIRASGDGVEIGKTGSNFRVLLSNDRLSFLQMVGGSTVEVAYMSNRKLFITDAHITHELAFGPDGGRRFVWTKASNGLSLRYISA